MLEIADQEASKALPPSFIGPSAAEGPSSSTSAIRPEHAYEPLKLSGEPTWVSPLEGPTGCALACACASVLESIEGELAEGDGRVLVGMDAEWCDAETPSLVQVSCITGLWVIDTGLRALQDEVHRASLRRVLLLIFSHPRVRILGFSFSRDMQRLQALSPEFELGAHNVFDVQEVYAKARALPRGKQPSLKRVCEDLLGCTLDKTHQCSDWDARPLSEAQVVSLSTDARVLCQKLPRLLLPGSHVCDCCRLSGRQ